MPPAARRHLQCDRFGAGLLGIVHTIRARWQPLRNDPCVTDAASARFRRDGALRARTDPARHDLQPTALLPSHLVLKRTSHAGAINPAGRTTEFPMPDHDDIDERIARLQRAAYGAHVTDEERAAAEAELAALRAPDSAPAADPEPMRASGNSEPAPAPEPSPGHAPLRSAQRGLLRALAWSTAALVAGIAIGWGVGSAVEPSEGADVGVPVTETRAWEVFDRPATDGDFVRHPGPLVDIGTDDSTRRLLLTRSDGVRLIAVRTTGGEDACLILALPVGRPATACTEDGRFPRDGLRAEISVQGVGVYLAGWNPDGRAEINTASAPTG
jgi:hypothetical protein